MRLWLLAVPWSAAQPQNDARHINMEPYRLWKNEEGATAVEYALIASLIAGVIGLTVSAIGGTVLNIFTAAAAMFP